MRNMSPGLITLVKDLFLYWLLSASAYAFCAGIQGNEVHLLSFWTITLLLLPGFFTVRAVYSDYSNARAAAALGATVVPTVQEKWPVSLNTMKRFTENAKSRHPGDILFEWKEKYGNTYQICLPLERRVFTFDPAHVKEILVTQFSTFEKGRKFYEQAHSLLGNGIFNSDGDMWKFHRSMTRPFFAKYRTNDPDKFAVHADEALRQIKTRLFEGFPIDFQDLVSRFSLDVATQFLLGTDFKSLSAGLAYPESSGKSNPKSHDDHPSRNFFTALFHAQKHIYVREGRGETWPLSELLGDEIKPHRMVIDDYITPLVEQSMARQRSGNFESLKLDSPTSLLDHLAQSTEDLTIIKDELINILVAARDSTASLLTFSVYMLAEHPNITEKLRDEIMGMVGTKGYPSYGQIHEMKYLRAFLNEVLRLYPPVPFNSRTSNKDTILESKTSGVCPFYIPAGMRVAYSVFMIHRRTDLWGPDALEFDPDRFLDERYTQYLSANPFIFCPFNAGPRVCLGQQFSYHEASFFLIRLLQQYSKFTLARDAQPLDSLPPKEWEYARGPERYEKIHPQVHLTVYSKVSGFVWSKILRYYGLAIQKGYDNRWKEVGSMVKVIDKLDRQL